jgi:hypothetical protein
MGDSMSTIINATTTNGVVIQPDNSGSLVLQTNNGTTALTISTAQNVAFAKGFTVGATASPAFSAYLGSNQSITSGVFTKIQFNTEAFDTNSNYDNATNYRFTPTVAGYYQINGKFASTVNTTLLVITMYKNGSEFIRGGDNRVSQNAGSSVSVNALVYCNGTTDYLELYPVGNV